MTSRSRDEAGIVVPLRSFTMAKARLAGVLSEAEREALARSMAERVVRAAASRPVAVVTSAPEVVAFANEHRCDVLADPGSLDAAAAAGREWAAGHELTRYAIVHGDLPFARSFDAILTGAGPRDAVIVPDQRDDGTPVLSLPTDVPFGFAYGPGSAARHATEARRAGLTVRMLHDDELGFDVDVADDLAALESRRRTRVR
jgi:2-phospho-L-lactate guanylyltransferase